MTNARCIQRAFVCFPEPAVFTACQWEDITIEYIPHKCLTFKSGKNRIKIWDIAQYYCTSLDTASKKYLGKCKVDIETKRFTSEIIKKRFDEIKKYCIQDAVLCAELSMYLLKKLNEFGIKCTGLYSSAYLSGQYFSDKGKVVSSWQFWQLEPELLQYALDSYEGGKFEITSRGKFYGYEYDIVSAYPYEISNLIDISLCSVKKSREYQRKADYGFLRCHIDNSQGACIPCGIMRGGVRVYPSGVFYLTITKQEYDYLQEINVPCEILSGYWIFTSAKKFYPYKKVVDTLFKLKSEYKKKGDLLLTMLAKIMLNGFYGKLLAMTLIIERPGPGEIEDNKYYLAGRLWNVIYGSVITANTRIKVCRMQNRFKDKCIAVHTDSVILTCKLPENEIKNEIGEFNFDCEGAGVLLACGQYEIGEKSAYKGFIPIHDDNWKSILEKNLAKSIIDYPYLKVESWLEAMAKGHFKKINYFSDETKKINLNADIKRLWKKTIRARDLLDNLEQSLPIIHIETSSPDWWQA